jgi:hypothetical protein
MSIVSALMEHAPDRFICKELKLLYASNRMIEAFDGMDGGLNDTRAMALTKLEKFVLKRAFKELRRKNARERLKEWMVHYAVTGQDKREVEAAAIREGQRRDRMRMNSPTFTLPPQYNHLTHLNRAEAQRISEAFREYNEQVKAAKSEENS